MRDFNMKRYFAKRYKGEVKAIEHQKEVKEMVRRKIRSSLTDICENLEIMTHRLYASLPSRKSAQKHLQ